MLKIYYSESKPPLQKPQESIYVFWVTYFSFHSNKV